MTSKDRAEQLAKSISKSLYDLLEVLGDIDENDPSNADNEWSITDDEGGTIMLAYKPQTKELTVSRNGLKLSVKATAPKRKIRLVMPKNKG